MLAPLEAALEALVRSRWPKGPGGEGICPHHTAVGLDLEPRMGDLGTYWLHPRETTSWRVCAAEGWGDRVLCQPTSLTRALLPLIAAFHSSTGSGTIRPSCTHRAHLSYSVMPISWVPLP